MEEIGVQLVVEGLDSFVGNMDKAKSTLLDLIAPPSLLQDAFGSLGNALGGFADWVGNVLTFTLGGLLTDAIQGVTSAIGNMIQSAVAAGQEFQTLSIRLEGINANSAELSTLSFTDALTKARDMTKDEIKWIQQMAIITPFTATGIASVYTMQRAMGLSDQGAKDLTVSITNWAAGMGLSEASVNRLSVALGKATSAGKVDGLTMRALRTEFVPIPAVLEQMAKNLGTTVEALEALQKKGELAPEPFIKAFEQIANQRFPDAANALAHTWEGSISNLRDIVSNFGGGDIVKPLLDVLGGVTGNFVDMFAVIVDGAPKFTELGTRLQTYTVSIGESISEIVSGVLGLLPGVGEVGTSLVDNLGVFATWLKENKEGIIADVKGIFDWIEKVFRGETEVPILTQLISLWNQLTAINTVTGQNGFQDLSDAISNLGKSIASVLDPFLKPLGITLENSRPSLQGFIDGLTRFTAWIDEHQAQIQWLLGAFIAFEIIQTISNLVLSLGIALISLLFSIGAITIVAAILVVAFFAIIGVFALFTAGLALVQLFVAGWAASVRFWIDLVVGFFQNLVRNVQTAVAQIITSFQRGDFGGMIRGVINLMLSAWNAGISSFVTAAMNFGGNVVGGFRDGFFAQWWTLSMDITNAFYGMIAFIKSLLGITSPSKVFAGIGTNMIAGMAQGITDATGLAVGAMEGMVAAVTMPAIAAPAVMQQYSQMAPSSISSTYQSSQTNNLNIHTSADTEPIVQDFRMMSSLTGA